MEKEIETLNKILNEIKIVVYADISNIDARIKIQEIIDKVGNDDYRTIKRKN